MTWLQIFGGLLALVVAIVPPLIAAFVRKKTIERERADALTRHSISELHIGTDRVRKHQTQPPV
jgi:hypothetical protein